MFGERSALAREALERLASPVAEMPRLLCILAHPDDEVIALGGRLHRMGRSRLLTVTDGAPRDGEDARQHGFTSLEAYRRARREELLCALRQAGLEPEFAPEFASAVPDQEVSLHLGPLTRAIAAEIRTFAPEAVLTHPYEGGHPDHDGCAFAVHAAVRWLAQVGAMEAVPPILEAPFYHRAENGGMATGAFLKNADAAQERAVRLTEAEQGKKRELLDCFVSQRETLAQFDVAFERFRAAPAYDFSQRAHEGELFYEGFPWGMRGERFCELALAASEEVSGGPQLACGTEEKGLSGF